jgi:hypothetical protein
MVPDMRVAELRLLRAGGGMKVVEGRGVAVVAGGGGYC